MSHHLDSPIARQDIRLDITDLYVFRAQMGTAFVINVCHSIFGAIPVPGYHPEGMYEFKIDSNGDAVEDITYRLTFDARDEHGKQRYIVRYVNGQDAVDPHAPGTVVAQGTTGETTTTPSGLRVWADKAGDPFWIEPDVLHAVPGRHDSESIGLGSCPRQEPVRWPHGILHRLGSSRSAVVGPHWGQSPSWRLGSVDIGYRCWWMAFD
jgi:hypothetical protein